MQQQMTEAGKKRQPPHKNTVGRDFVGAKRVAGTYLSVSFKHEDAPVLETLKRMLEQDDLPISETVVDAIRMRYGVSDLNLVRIVIFERYADGELNGPKRFKVFDDILKWELEYNDSLKIAEKWNISRQIMGCLAYLYFSKPR